MASPIPAAWMVPPNAPPAAVMRMMMAAVSRAGAMRFPRASNPIFRSCISRCTAQAAESVMATCLFPRKVSHAIQPMGSLSGFLLKPLKVLDPISKTGNNTGSKLQIKLGRVPPSPMAWDRASEARS